MHVSYNINYGGQMMRQRVVLNYRDNLIMIDASAIEGKTPARLIHHTEVKCSVFKIKNTVWNYIYDLI